MQIEAGDLIGCQGSGWLSDQIRAATGNGPLSHIAVVTASLPFVQVTEAIDRVRTRPLVVRLSESVHVWHLKPLLLTVGQRGVAATKALGFSGDDYGWGDLALVGLDEVARTTWFTDHFSGHYEHHPFCSMMAELCLPGYVPRFDPKFTTPNDFWFEAIHLSNTPRWGIAQLQ